MRSPNFYAGLGLDRFAQRRRDTAWIAERLTAPQTRLMPVWRTHSFVVEASAPAAGWLSPADWQGLDPGDVPVLYLGETDTTAYFALDLSQREEAEVIARFAGRGRFADLRSVGPLLGRQDGALLAYARGLVHWHRRHQFCGACGSPTRIDSAGHVRICVSDACMSQHFPRTDPAVIMLVTDGDRCLLGRQSTWPPGMHSTLAGFVEPGESLEEAVAREVREEAGIIVTDVRYHSSQPWPFPSSIMLGFWARATSSEIRIDPEELEAAHWFTRAELRGTHDPDVFRLPRADSIARRLVEDWLDES